MIKKEYERWCRLVTDKALTFELDEIKNDLNRIQDAFYCQLEFGTGGLRGVLGAGTNRMNIYTVARASAGLLNYVIKNGGKKIAIGYDTRINSQLFAKTAASVFSLAGLKAYIYSEPLPTPMLSYAVRELGCNAGVMITASHNPSEYNGYKVYGADGCQITDATASEILANINSVDYFDYNVEGSFDELLADGKIEYISEKIVDKYILTVSATSVRELSPKDKQVKIVYSNLNGTGILPVSRILYENGYNEVLFVKEQMEHDGRFPTCPYPNPEISEAMTLGLSLCEENGADILIATDPDCDRVGVGARNGVKMKLLNGNEVGILLFDYIAESKRESGIMPNAPVAVKTIVTTDLADKIALKYGVEMKNVLTGFKYIGEVIGSLEEESKEDNYIFGFEESCGYLGGTYVRDKDGVFASLLVAEMAAYYKSLGKTLFDRLREIYSEHGYVKNTLNSYAFKGVCGNEKMQSIMNTLRMGVEKIAALKVVNLKDYKNGVDGLPVSNVLKFYLEGGSTVVVRPSGTEPKLKIYISAVSRTFEEAQKLTDDIKRSVEAYM